LGVLRDPRPFTKEEKMKPVTYICEQYPALNIGSTTQREVKFRLGRFVATEKWQVKMIEENEWYNCFIFKAEPHTPEPIPAGGPLPIPKPQRDGTSNPPVVVGAATSNETEDKTEDDGEDTPEDDGEDTPEYAISDTAVDILEAAGIKLADAATRLELADGDRLTVKMAEGLVSDG
jgi:hypothetical protein